MPWVHPECDAMDQLLRLKLPDIVSRVTDNTRDSFARDLARAITVDAGPKTSFNGEDHTIQMLISHGIRSGGREEAESARVAATLELALDLLRSCCLRT